MVVITRMLPMAKLSSKARKKIPASDFAGPNRSYPIENKSHARDAKARASEMEAKGNISKSQEETIDAKANVKLSKKRGSSLRDYAKGVNKRFGA